MAVIVALVLGLNHPRVILYATGFGADAVVAPWSFKFIV